MTVRAQHGFVDLLHSALGVDKDDPFDERVENSAKLGLARALRFLGRFALGNVVADDKSADRFPILLHERSIQEHHHAASVLGQDVVLDERVKFCAGQ